MEIVIPLACVFEVPQFIQCLSLISLKLGFMVESVYIVIVILTGAGG